MSGEDVKRILAAHGITQRELATSLGTSPQNIGSQLSKEDVRTGLLEDISRVTGIPLQDFLIGPKGAVKFTKQEAEPNTVPLLPIFAQAGSLSGWSEGVEEVKCERVISPVKDIDMAVHLRNLKAICNFALDEELTTFYPFRKFHIRTEETRKKALTLEQIRAFATADITYRNDAMHRDVFMLMFYLRGINVSDLAELTWDDVEDGRIYYRRNKTGKLYSIRLEPEMLDIIERWRGEEHLLAVFDRYKKPNEYNRRLSEALKRICGQDGRPIEPDCSSNWARHTWATLAAELDIPEATITWGMGHEPGHRTTAIYIKRNQEKVDDANRLVMDYVLGISRE